MADEQYYKDSDGKPMRTKDGGKMPLVYFTGDPVTPYASIFRITKREIWRRHGGVLCDLCEFTVDVEPVVVLHGFYPRDRKRDRLFFHIDCEPDCRWATDPEKRAAGPLR